MDYTFMLLFMIFYQIVDDDYLQKWLSSAKQKKYEEENAPDEMYRRDYIRALITESFSWTFMVMSPIAFKKGFEVDVSFFVAFIINLVLHAFIDDLKVNKRIINLWTERLLHFGQIVLTLIFLF